MLRKTQKAQKKPKFPTRLEESMLKRKDQEFICTCYGDMPADNTSLPASIEEELPLPDEAGLHPRDGVSMAMERAKKRCDRMHIMYKTPAQVLREMDAERHRMTLIAELTDLIDKKISKQKEAKRKKKLKAKKDKKEQPPWYQEISLGQMNSTEMLGSALMADMEEGGMERTMILIENLGIKPMPPREVIWHVMVNCYTSPVLFLFYLSLCLEPRERPDKDGEPAYAIRERIVLSCLTHLLIPRTLFDLHFLLPPPEILDEESEKVHTPLKVKKRKIYKSPYLQPQPALLDRPMKEMRPIGLKIIDATPAEIEDFYKFYLATHKIKSSISYVQRKINHFKAIKKQHRLKAKRSYIRLTRKCGELQEIENSYHRQVSYLPTLFPNYPNETYTSLRYFSSTNPPDTSSLEQIQELRDQAFYPMMSLDHCATSWDFHKLSGLRGTLNPPLAHVLVDERTTPTQIKCLEGYFHAYPPLVYKAPVRKKHFITTNPLHSRDFKEYLKEALKYLAQRGNPLAALPKAYLLPHIHKWILKRYRYKMSSSFEIKLNKRLLLLFERNKYKMTIDSKPLFCKLNNMKNLTWDKRLYLEKWIKRTNGRFFKRIQRKLVNEGRELWPLMCTKYYDITHFRDAFFAYIPCKQRDVTFPLEKYY